MATLQDIADVVGVSTVTVSKVLRGKVKGSWPRSAAQAQRIREVADELGYRVDWRARALKTKRTYMIGLLNTDKPETHSFNTHVLNGLIETFGEAGYHLVFVRVGEGSRGEDFADARFDGIVIDYHLEPQELDIIQQAKLPAVIINAPGPGGAVSVMPDHFAAGRIAAEHLLEIGHERIGLVQSSVAEQSRWPQHMVSMWKEGIRAALRDAGKLDRYVEIIPQSPPAGQHEVADAYYDVLRETLSTPDRPTALIVDNPQRAVNFILAQLNRLELTCPKDLSLLAMEDVPELAWCEPQLSAVKIPFDWLGREAARRLLTLIEASDEIESTIKPDEILPSLVLRASTASPPIKPKPVP